MLKNNLTHHCNCIESNCFVLGKTNEIINSLQGFIVKKGLNISGLRKITFTE